jgi:TPR repeat protein
VAALKKTAIHFKLSVDQGKLETIYLCATCLQNGYRVAKDYCAAAPHHKLSAAQGNTSGQFFYALGLIIATGVSHNPSRAVKYLKQCSDAGECSFQRG